MVQLLYAVEPAKGHHYHQHPEGPARIHTIEQHISAPLLEAGSDQTKRIVEYKRVLEQQLEAVHERSHIAAVAAAAARVQAPEAIRDADDPDGPTYACPTTYEDALTAVSAALALVDALVASNSGSRSPAAFSICRPPGHHATPREEMGFCLFNNAALAAKHAQQKHGLRRVLILDWDVHHGNGTQDIFYSDPSVLFIDVHQDGVWPKTGHLTETGAGKGVGATINVPLPWYASVQRVFSQVVAPSARRFQPDIILVSAGYDAHWQDPLEHLQLQSASFHWLAAHFQGLAQELCSGRLLFLLEWGYHLEALGEAVAETLRALLGRPPATALLRPEELPEPEPLEAVGEVVAAVRQLHGLSD